MKKYTLSFLLLWLAIAVSGQMVERIAPATGYHSWKNIQFDTILKGVAETESGITFSTTDGGKSWKEGKVNEVKNSKEIPPLKTFQLGRWKSRDFVALSQLSDTLYAGRTSRHSPDIVLAGSSGKYWKVLNGATFHSVSSVWTDDKTMTVADNSGNVFYSDDRGQSFTKTKSGDHNCWPELKEHNGSLYYFDGVTRLMVSRDFGKTWHQNNFLRHDQDVAGVYIFNDSVRYFVTGNRLIKAEHNFTVKTDIAILKGDDTFVKLSQHGNKAVAITKRGSLFLYENDHWSKRIIDSTKYFTGVAYDGTKIAITTSDNMVYFSEDGNSFIPLITPLSGYNSYFATFYGKYLILELRDKTSMKGNILFIYNTELKTSVMREIDTSRYGYGTTGFYKNYVFGTLGSVHKIVGLK